MDGLSLLSGKLEGSSFTGFWGALFFSLIVLLKVGVGARRDGLWLQALGQHSSLPPCVDIFSWLHKVRTSLAVMGLRLLGLLLWHLLAFLGFLSSRTRHRSISFVGALLGLLLSKGRSVSLVFWRHLEM